MKEQELKDLLAQKQREIGELNKQLNVLKAEKQSKDDLMKENEKLILRNSQLEIESKIVLENDDLLESD